MRMRAVVGVFMHVVSATLATSSQSCSLERENGLRRELEQQARVVAELTRALEECVASAGPIKGGRADGPDLASAAVAVDSGPCPASNGSFRPAKQRVPHANTAKVSEGAARSRARPFETAPLRARAQLSTSASALAITPTEIVRAATDRPDASHASARPTREQDARHLTASDDRDGCENTGYMCVEDGSTDFCSSFQSDTVCYGGRCWTPAEGCGGPTLNPSFTLSPTTSQRPSPQPSVSMLPTPSTLPTTATSYSELRDAIAPRAEVNILSDILLDAPITIEQGVKVTLYSTTSAVLDCGGTTKTSCRLGLRDCNCFNVGGALTLRGLNLKHGHAEVRICERSRFGS